MNHSFGYVLKTRYNLCIEQFLQGEGRKKHIGRILEFFRTTQGEDYFRVQWYFRVEDTVSVLHLSPAFTKTHRSLFSAYGCFGLLQVIKEAATFHDEKRIFYSTMMNDNLLDCILSKVHVAEIPLAVCSNFESFHLQVFLSYITSYTFS